MSTEIRAEIRGLVADIKPHDPLEASHIEDALSWIDSPAPLFRIAKPDNPSKHLVSYFVLYDEKTNHLMLVDHIKANAWLPAGGHIELNEHPCDTVAREAMEELGIDANFASRFGAKPFFITVTATKGHGSHTDVSLWFVIKGDFKVELTYDPSEMNGYKWLTPQQILGMDTLELDPHMHRFVQKFIA